MDPSSRGLQGGFEAPNQLCAWDPETRSALVQGATVLNVFACKAKRRDPRYDISTKFERYHT